MERAVATHDERRLTLSMAAIAITCGVAAIPLGGLTVIGVTGARGLVDLSAAFTLLLYGLPTGFALAGAIGILARRRWGFVAARLLATVAVVVAGLLCFLLLVPAVSALFAPGGGDAAPPAWYIAVIALIAGIIAAVSLVLLRATTAELRRWDSDVVPPRETERLDNLPDGQPAAGCDWTNPDGGMGPQAVPGPCGRWVRASATHHR